MWQLPHCSLSKIIHIDKSDRTLTKALENQIIYNYYKMLDPKLKIDF
jgi:hypothetical protein